MTRLLRSARPRLLLRAAALALAAGLGLQVPAGAGPVNPTFPVVEHTAIHVMAEGLAGARDLAARDTGIPGSQVFLTGEERSSTLAYEMLGEVLVRSRDVNQQVTVEKMLRRSFAPRTAEGLQREIAARALQADYGVVDSAAEAQVQLHPALQLRLRKDGSARANVRWTVRFNDPKRHHEARKIYTWFGADSRPMLGADGWTADDAARVRATAAQGGDRLARVLLDDLQGALANGEEPAGRTFITYTTTEAPDTPTRALLLKEYADFIAIAPLAHERVSLTLVQVLERSAITLHGTGDPATPTAH